MRKSKSFSTYGAFLERKATLKINPQTYNKAIIRGKESPMQADKKDAVFVQGFDRVTSREKPSSYQLFNIKDHNNQANYNPKNEKVQTRNAFYPVRTENQKRLNKLIVQKQKYETTPMDKTCQRFRSIDRDEGIMTVRDLQNKRKSYHSMDFTKQSNRPNSYIGRHQGRQTTTQDFINTKQTKFSKGSDLNIQKGDPMLKSNSVHSFGSYTKRQFLSEKKLSMKRAPPSSGAESFQVPQQKFKKHWKVISPPKFEKVSKKHLNRYDAINEPWYTKLGYNAKEDLVKEKVPVLKISLQTSREVNQVHSKYPIRLAS